MDHFQQYQYIRAFRDYLKMCTMGQNIDYDKCTRFLLYIGKELNLSHKIYYGCCVPRKPLIIFTFAGSRPELPAIFAASHMDVAATAIAKWTHHPFAADVDDDGRIFGRGAQDSKSVGMQYFFAIRELQRANIQPKRTLHIGFLPDHSNGYGLRDFVGYEPFKALNIGFVLVPGSATSDDKFVLYNADRSVWQIIFKFTGNFGHGAMLMEKTAAEHFSRFLGKLMEYRSSELKRLESNPELRMCDVTTFNLTTINGGLQMNTIAPAVGVSFDIRIPVQVDLKQFEELLESWCHGFRDNVEWQWIQKRNTAPATKLDGTNPFYCTMSNTFEKLCLNFETCVNPCATDAHYFRAIGIPCIGFSPMNCTPPLMHCPDEYLKVDVFLRGIEIYKEIFRDLLNLET